VSRDAPVRVRFVVVNFNGGELTLRCLRTLLATEWPAASLEIVLVDNASTDGVVTGVRREFRVVRIVESAKNLGFGGGCNLGLVDLDRVDYVALVNPDAFVEPGWLRPLVSALERDPGLGAACPRTVLASPYREVRIDVVSDESPPRAIRVLDARVGGHEARSRVRFVAGVWGPEGDGTGGRWTRGATATMLVPSGAAATADTSAELLLAACEDARITVTAGASTASYDVDAMPRWYAVPEGGDARRYLNSAGVSIDREGFGHDRGYLEPDDGRYGDEEEVDAWSGTAVLLRAAYLRDVGTFDPRLFMYYEDIELSWRGAKRGWRYRYVPTALVYHEHSATAVAGSRFAEYHNERSRLLMLARHASPARATQAAVRSLLVTASYARRDASAAIGRPCVPEQHHSRTRLAAFGSFLRGAPAMARARRTGD
jgi:GT2 family glycosyltransferase